MAHRLRCVCGECGYTFDIWSDGNPYYFDENGEKQYAYHPDHERLSLCIGNDRPHLCLSCRNEFMMDSRAPISACPVCGSHDFVDTYQLIEHRCRQHHHRADLEQPVHRQHTDNGIGVIGVEGCGGYYDSPVHCVK